MSKRVSLKDIAIEVGVSTALVSYVLTGKEKEARVGIEKAKQIKKVAKRLNYQPNLIARGLKSGRTKTLGLIVADISNPFFATLARIIENEAGKLGYTVIIGSSDEKIEKSKNIIETFLNRQVDGMIITPVEGAKPQITELEKRKIPFVLIDRSFSNTDKNVVVIDNRDASKKAVEALVKNGYIKIGMLTYDTELTHIQNRIQGYKDALNENGINLKESWIRYVSYENTQEDVDKALSYLLKGKPSRVTALFFATNSISVSALRFIAKSQIKIPDDLGLICFDESEVYDFFYTPVSFVKQNLDAIGQSAVTMLAELIERKLLEKRRIVVPAALIQRESSGKIL